jgi:hypothetical protein
VLQLIQRRSYQIHPQTAVTVLLWIKTFLSFRLKLKLCPRFQKLQVAIQRAGYLDRGDINTSATRNSAALNNYPNIGNRVLEKLTVAYLLSNLDSESICLLLCPLEPDTSHCNESREFQPTLSRPSFLLSNLIFLSHLFWSSQWFLSSIR